MLIYLDANVIIYLIDQPPVWGPRASAHVGALLARGDVLVVSDLARMECRVLPLASGDAVRLAEFDAFFASADVRMVSVSADVCNRAGSIRAAHRFKPLDSLHLAAAVEHGCDQFLTNDVRLSAYPDISVATLT